MLIIENKANQVVTNLDNIMRFFVEEETFKNKHGDIGYSIKFFTTEGIGGTIGFWDTKESAEAALRKIIQAYHCGNKEVYLDD